MSMFDDAGLFDYLADQSDRHARTTSWWRMNDQLLRAEVEDRRPDFESMTPLAFGPLESMRFSYFGMGAIDSLDLFGLDELLLFAFYWRNRDRYPRVADVGANIGLHTVVLARLGMSVTSYEPDPVHVAELQRNLEANSITTADVIQAAVNVDGEPVTFTRVVGNTTGSHISGAKADPYGELEHFEVSAAAIGDVVSGVDLIKMDVEGFEAHLLLGLSDDQLGDVDVIGEIGTDANAGLIYERFVDTDFRLFTQKRNWQPVQGPEDMPTSYREGSFFLSRKAEMPWL